MAKQMTKSAAKATVKKAVARPTSEIRWQMNNTRGPNYLSGSFEDGTDVFQCRKNQVGLAIEGIAQYAETQRRTFYSRLTDAPVTWCVAVRKGRNRPSLVWPKETETLTGRLLSGSRMIGLIFVSADERVNDFLWLGRDASPGMRESLKQEAFIRSIDYLTMQAPVKKGAEVVEFPHGA
jgi:hypothetical protein